MCNINISLNEKFTFENFIVGESNKIAFKAGVNLVKGKSDILNPLYIYGNHGLGKTHLLHAIGNTLLKNDPTLKIIYIPMDQFTNEMIQHIKDGRNDEFIAKYATYDVLLVDDVQNIRGKEMTQQKFVNICKNMVLQNKIIAMASTIGPNKLEVFQADFSSIFDLGVAIEVEKFDSETSKAMIEKVIVDEKLSIDKSELESILEKEYLNGRLVKQALHKAHLYNELKD